MRVLGLAWIPHSQRGQGPLGVASEALFMGLRQPGVGKSVDHPLESGLELREPRFEALDLSPGSIINHFNQTP